MNDKSVPHELLQSLQNVEGFNEKTFLDIHESGNQVTSLRINPAKHKSGADHLFPGSEKVPWSSLGYYLPARPSFIFDPLLHAGAYYVQEASGMFIEQCLKQTVDLTRPLQVLDLCAAPGGKSTLIQSLISQDSLLVSNEVIKTRVGVLVENVSKWGAENIIVTNNDPRDFRKLEHYFDVMMVDAPCSGSGLFRRDPEAINEWSVEAVRTCTLRQQRILEDAWSTLKHNGILIYSTCSYSPQEDEDICDWLMSNHHLEPIRLELRKEWNIIETRSSHNVYCYRFFPDKLKGEGFFVACFRKKEGDERDIAPGKKNKVVKATNLEKEIIKPWIAENSSLLFFHSGDQIHAIPEKLESGLQIIRDTLFIKKAGVPIGKIVRNEMLPAHELALSGLVNKKLLTISLKKDEALQYLRKEEVTIPGGEKGWALIDYEGMMLGWVKVLSNRANNYYPREWRILKSGNH